MWEVGGGRSWHVKVHFDGNGRMYLAAGWEHFPVRTASNKATSWNAHTAGRVASSSSRCWAAPMRNTRRTTSQVVVFLGSFKIGINAFLILAVKEPRLELSY
jgi:hypothetical protein